MKDMKMKSMVNEAIIDAELRRENRVSLAKKGGVKIVVAIETPKVTAMELAFRNAIGYKG